MFELSVAFKYLIPRWRQLSVSIISLISILVIALVVWLIVVFFSVTHGLERGWVNKLIALTAPVRVTPTEAYYDSYYYHIDSISQDAGYTTQTIGQKLGSIKTDPYDPEFDQEIPPHWSSPDLNGNGELKDIVKLAFSEIEKIKGTTAKEYEMTITNLKLKMIRTEPMQFSGNPDDDQDQRVLSQAIYLSSFDPSNPNLPKIMFPVSAPDVDNLVRTAENEGLQSSKQMRTAVQNILATVTPLTMKTPVEGMMISQDALPEGCQMQVCVLNSGSTIHALYIPRSEDDLDPAYGTPATLTKTNGLLSVELTDGHPIPLESWIPVYLLGNTEGSLLLDKSTLESAETAHDIKYHAEFAVQGATVSTLLGLDDILVDQFTIDNQGHTLWVFDQKIPDSLPSNPLWGDAILLPKSWRESGALIGDRGYLSYQTPTASSIQEQRIPIYVAGFFDPGILPMGGRVLLANDSIVSIIRSGNPMDDSPLSNGINVRIPDLDDAEAIKAAIEKGFQQAGIDKYWRVQTFREFEFTKDFLQQLRSERNLFTLISMVIIIVACSNIVSMLIILVNDKRIEIGILRSMGATSQSIAAIFGFCGIVMGLIGSLIGIGLALITLQNLQHLIDFISHVQGFEMFNPAFFGDTLPNEVSFEALTFVLTSTALISLIAGVVPAVKASLLRPSAILRSE